MQLKKWQSRALRLAGSAALIVGIFWFIPFSEVVEALRSVRLGYAGVGLALMLVSTYLEALQLWLLAERVGMPLSAWGVFEIKLITRFYGQFLPSELLASALKLHRLAAATRQWGEAAAAILFSRLINMLVLVVLGFGLWAIDMPEGAGRWVGVILLGMCAGLIGVHATVVSPALSNTAGRALARWGPRWLKAGLLGKVTDLMQKAVASYRIFGSAMWPIAALAVVRHAVGIVGFSLIAQSLDIHLSLLTIGWIRVVLHAIMMVPISLSGIGVREGSLVILLQEYAVPASDAVALAFLLFALTLLNNSLGGVFELRNLVRLERGVLTRGDTK